MTDFFVSTWEQRKLESIITINSGRDYKHLSKGNIPVYGTGGDMLSVNKALSKFEDAIGIGRKGTINRPFILKAPFWTVDTLFYCIPKHDNSVHFVNNLFKNINWMKYDESTGVPSLSKQTISNIVVLIPKFKEQLIIGSFLKELDSTITLHHRK